MADLAAPAGCFGSKSDSGGIRSPATLSCIRSRHSWMRMIPIDTAARAFIALVAQSLCSAQQFKQPYCLPFASRFNRDGSRMLGSRMLGWI